MPNQKILSSDSHIYEPSDLWTSRLDSKFGERAPRVVREEGDDWWYCDGIKIGGFHLGGSQLGLRFVAPAQMTDTGKAEDVIPGAYIPDERLKDLDADGVYGEIIYPTVGFLLYKVPDTELLDAICCAYNDWLAEFCRPFPHRIKGVAMLNTDDVAAAVREMEMERCVGMGLSGAMISVYPPEGREYYSPEYEPLWAAAQDLGVPLSLHVASNRAAPGTPGAFSSTHFDRVNADHWVRQSLSDMVLGGVFERHPKLRVGSVEMELSWAAHFLERIDYVYTQRRFPSDSRYKESMLPSDYFHRNLFLSFQEDALGIRLRDVLGVDNLLWGSDYPHPESTFPRSQQILEKILAECTEDEKAKITWGNTNQLYSFTS